jgi:septin family protein
MTSEYIESTCGLHNGVRFEQLQVDTFYEDKSPKKFRVVLAFEGHLIDSIYNKQVDRIYFNRPTGMYLWRTDTFSNGMYHKYGMHKERINKMEVALDSVTETRVIADYDNIQKLEAETKAKIKQYQSTLQKTCPEKFKPNTWYYITFFDQRYEAYLYVDKEMNYKIEKISLPTNF